MNILTVSTVFMLNSAAAFLSSGTNYEIAQSLHYVIRNFFIKQSSSFAFLLSCDHPQTLYYFKDLLEVIYEHQDDIKIQLTINSKDIQISKYGERVSNLLLVDSAESFLKLDPASKVRRLDFNEYYYILLQGPDADASENIQRIFDYCWINFLINVDIQIQQASGEIIIYTYFPFTKAHCGKVVPVEISRFLNGTMANKDLFPQKLLNMHNCSVRVATWDVMPYIKVELGKYGIEKVDGFEGKLLTQLSKQMNFKIDILVPPNNEKRGIVGMNHSTGAIRMLRNKEADMSLGCFQFDVSRTVHLTASDSYFQASNLAVFMANTSYSSSIEALWFPFESDASLGLLVAFLISLSLLYALSLGLGKCSGFHPSARQRNMCLGFVAGTLGLPSGLGSRRNFVRIFLMTWFLFAFVIRTEYGAIIYHFIRNNLFRKAPTKMQDMVRLGYKFALINIAFESLNRTSIFRDTGLAYIIVSDSYKGGVYRFLEEHPNEKFITIAPLVFLSYYAAEERKIGVLATLKDSVMSQNYCIYFTKHSFLVDRVNEIVQRVVSVGLMDVWVKEVVDWSFFMSKNPPNQATIGQEELQNVYYLCALMLMVSVLVFFLELMSVRVEFLNSLLRRI